MAQAFNLNASDIERQISKFKDILVYIVLDSNGYVERPYLRKQ